MDTYRQANEYRLIRLYDDPASGKLELDYFTDLRSRRGGSTLMEEDYFYFSLVLSRIALFCIRLTRRLDQSFGGLSALQGIPFMFAADADGIRQYRNRDILEPFGFRDEDIEEDVSLSTGVFEAWRHERLGQLSEVVKVVEFLSTNDFRLILNGLRACIPRGDTIYARNTSKREEMEEKIRTLVSHFYRAIVPLVFAVLWFWKARVRSEQSYERDRDEVYILWRALLQLFAVCESPFSNAVKNANPSHLVSLFNGDVGHTNDLVEDRCILDMSQAELWRTWSAVVWRSPGILPDPEEYECFVRALVLRIAVLTNTADTSRVFDCTQYYIVPDNELGSAEPLAYANDRFLTDTERLATVLLDNLFTMRYLMMTLDNDTPDAHATWVSASDNPTERAWLTACRETLAGRSGVFVREILPDRGWERYGYWGEVERYRERHGNPSVGVRHAMADFRKGHTDIVSNILQGSYATEAIWDRVSASRNIERRAMENSGCQGWSFRLLWDYHADVVKRRATSEKDAAFANVRIHIDPVTEKVTYIDKPSGMVIHGERFRALELLRARSEIAGGLVEANLLEDVALEIILNAEKRPRSQHLAFEFVQTQDTDTALALRYLVGRFGSEFLQHPIQDLASLGRLCILTHLNRYAVYDPKNHRTLAYVPQISVALRVWAEETERTRVIPKLNQFAARVYEIPVPDENNGRQISTNASIVRPILQLVYDLVALVPPTVRKVTHLQREQLLGRARIHDMSENGEVEYDPSSVTLSDWDRPDFLRALKLRVPTLDALRDALIAERRRANLAIGSDSENSSDGDDEVPWDLTDAIQNTNADVMSW